MGFSLNAEAQATLKIGRITDSKGKPVKGLEIKSASGVFDTITNENGEPCPAWVLDEKNKDRVPDSCKSIAREMSRKSKVSTQNNPKAKSKIKDR